MQRFTLNIKEILWREERRLGDRRAREWSVATVRRPQAQRVSTTYATSGASGRRGPRSHE